MSSWWCDVLVKSHGGEPTVPGSRYRGQKLGVGLGGHLWLREERVWGAELVHLGAD